MLTINKLLFRMKKTVLAGLILFAFSPLLSQNLVITQKTTGAFPVVAGNAAAGIYVDANDHWIVQKAASLLQEDIQTVTGIKPAMLEQLPSSGQNIILIGSMDNSSLIKKLIEDKKLNADGIKGKWEAFTIQVVNNPLKGINSALVIAGSDRRGTAYGVFELSQQAGVSPWYWWADVPAKKKKELFVKSGIYKYGSPSVKYRGIFINDEAPAFSGWTKEKFGGVNHQVYEKMFELLLRLKANYLWPAMWGNAFNDDDTLNPIMADKYGIVMGTSHHEPMLRAQQEWKRYGSGAWNYETNDTTLRKFWTKGIQNMGKHESIVTIGMRGDGDKPMTQGTAIGLLERIVSDQRKIIAVHVSTVACDSRRLRSAAAVSARAGSAIARSDTSVNARLMPPQSIGRSVLNGWAAQSRSITAAAAVATGSTAPLPAKGGAATGSAAATLGGWPRCEVQDPLRVAGRLSIAAGGPA